MIAEHETSMVPIDKIRVLNPRTRNEKKFRKIVESILHVGLKRPITVSRRKEGKGKDQFDLVCGQGRLEAFKRLNHEKIPAFILDIPKEEALLRSLVENIARRNTTGIELVRHIKILKGWGYGTVDIATKMDLNPSTVSGILRLLKNGEKGLLKAVEKEKISVFIAVQIATSEDTEIQKILHEAYENKQLAGNALMQTKKIIEQRKLYGKSLVGSSQKRKGPATATNMVRVYENETKRQKVLIKRARICETCLIFITNALRQLLEDKIFVDLLASESLDSFPKYLAEKIRRI